MDIDPQAPASARHETIIHAPLELVWSLIADIERWSKWNPSVTQAKLNGPFAPGTTFDWKSNGFSIHSTLQQIVPKTRIAWTGKAFGTSAIHVWNFASLGDRVHVETEESFNGWLVKMMPGSMQKTLDTALIAWLEHLKNAAQNV
jgi:uncharacterized protein YndB with AHSA1/START domain